MLSGPFSSFLLKARFWGKTMKIYINLQKFCVTLNMNVYDKGDITRKFRLYRFQLIESSRLAFVGMITNLPGQQREAQFYSLQLDLNFIPNFRLGPRF